MEVYLFQCRDPSGTYINLMLCEDSPVCAVNEYTQDSLLKEPKLAEIAVREMRASMEEFAGEVTVVNVPVVGRYTKDELYDAGFSWLDDRTDCVTQ